MNTLAVFKTFEGNGVKKNIVLWTYDGKKVSRLTGKAQLEFLKTPLPGTEVRLYSVSHTDIVLLQLQALGATITHAFFHDLGIDKGQEPEALLKALYNAPASVFRTFTADPAIAELRDILSKRNALAQFYGDAVRKLKQVGRNKGIVDEEDFKKDQEMIDFMKVLDSIYEKFEMENDKKRPVSYDTALKNAAKQIPACVVFNEIAGIKGGFAVAASVVAHSGGVERFPTVRHFWHYCGMHVLDGVAPKRKRGQNMTWNPELRKTLFMLTDSISKLRIQPWRDMLDAERAKEYAVHEQKHPGCKSKDWHCTMRARRKVAKEILKRYFLAMKGMALQANAATA